MAATVDNPFGLVSMGKGATFAICWRIDRYVGSYFLAISDFMSITMLLVIGTLKTVPKCSAIFWFDRRISIRR